MSMQLAEFNELPVPWARRDLLSCCAAPEWAELVAAALGQANLDYERRFGHVFLICATGLTAAQVLAAARAGARWGRVDS